MARSSRVRGAGGGYHVMGRGRDRGWLFGEDTERVHVLTQLEAMREMLRVRVYAYAQPDNHHHGLASTPEENPSRAMHSSSARRFPLAFLPPFGHSPELWL